MEKIIKLLEGLSPLLAFYPGWVRVFFFIVLMQVFIAIALFLFYFSSANTAKKTAEEKPDPRKSEIVFRLNNIVQLIESHPTKMNNANALNLESQLTGWSIGGAKEFEGVSTIVLLQQLEDSNQSYRFLSETRQHLYRIKEIVDDRTGERKAHVVQNMDYKSLGTIHDHLRSFLNRLANQ